MPINLKRTIVTLLAAAILMGQPSFARAADPFGDLKKFGTSIFGGGNDSPSSDSSKNDDPPVENTNQQENSGLGKLISGAIGAGLGGYLGSQFGDGKGKALATILGGAAGAWLGSELANAWSQADQTAVNRTSANALNSAHDGQSVTWNNPDTGATATITPQASRQENRNITIIRKKEVQAPPPFDVIGETYVAKKTSNMRSGPSTNALVIGSLKAGEKFTAVGRVQNQNWIIVGQNGRVIGYVLGTLVEARQQIASNDRSPPVQSSGTRPDNSGVDLDAVMRPAKSTETIKKEIASNGGIDLDAEGLVVEEVKASSSCRPAELKVTDTQSGKSETSNFKACKSADGAWEIL